MAFCFGLESMEQESEDVANRILRDVSIDSQSLTNFGNHELSPTATAELKESMRKHGFIMITGLLSPDDAAEWRALSVEHICKKKPLLEVGYMLSDLNAREEFQKPTAALINHPSIAGVFRALVGQEGVRYCGHSDIGVDRIVFWHKDKLNGTYAKYQRLSPWEVAPDGSTHQIYKLLLYLEDHSLDDDGLRVIPGSHVESQVQLAGRRLMQLRPALGDAILIDQRITHCGQLRARSPSHRILLSLGFGANNVFTDEFEQGTQARQAADQSALHRRAALPAWRSVAERIFHERFLWPLLSAVYRHVDPVLVQHFAQHIYG